MRLQTKRQELVSGTEELFTKLPCLVISQSSKSLILWVVAVWILIPGTTQVEERESGTEKPGVLDTDSSLSTLRCSLLHD